MKKEVSRIPILIPAYEPDERMIDLFRTIALDEEFILLVDDGSGADYKDIFDRAEDMLGENGHVIHYDTNMGKGYALKTGFKWIIDNMPEAVGCVTADSDGQHSADCIKKVQDELIKHPDDLIMGVRNLDGDDVPSKSKIGNKLILILMRVFGGVKGTDVQTGLRGISKDFMGKLLECPGNRFEFEIEMLLATKKTCNITETEIKTIYDSKDNHQTHYSPIKDSMRIGKVLFGHFAGFMLSSLSSSVVDLVLFAIFSHILNNGTGVWYVTVSAVLARIISGTYNYFINYKLVFKSKESVAKSAMKYVLTAICIMVLSAGFTTLGVKFLPGIPEVVVKLVVDVVLFITSYNVQKKLVF